MPRKANQARLENLQQAIAQHPGKRAGFFSRLFNWSREEVSRKLVTLNDRSILVSEDKHGGLWPFDKNSA
ncbi:MAG: hypothetical protein HZB51_23665 [Chloroflexi bacterium]|nr:hypothetical protein [Chloroflexota bacterium]